MATSICGFVHAPRQASERCDGAAWDDVDVCGVVRDYFCRDGVCGDAVFAGGFVVVRGGGAGRVAGEPDERGVVVGDVLRGGDRGEYGELFCGAVFWGEAFREISWDHQAAVPGEDARVL